MTQWFLHLCDSLASVSTTSSRVGTFAPSSLAINRSVSTLVKSMDDDITTSSSFSRSLGVVWSSTSASSWPSSSARFKEDTGLSWSNGEGDEGGAAGADVFKCRRWWWCRRRILISMFKVSSSCLKLKILTRNVVPGVGDWKKSCSISSPKLTLPYNVQLYILYSYNYPEKSLWICIWTGCGICKKNFKGRQNVCIRKYIEVLYINDYCNTWYYNIMNE